MKIELKGLNSEIKAECKVKCEKQVFNNWHLVGLALMLISIGVQVYSDSIIGSLIFLAGVISNTVGNTK